MERNTQREREREINFKENKENKTKRKSEIEKLRKIDRQKQLTER